MIGRVATPPRRTPVQRMWILPSTSETPLSLRRRIPAEEMLADAKVAIAAALDEHDGHVALGERHGRGEPAGPPRIRTSILRLRDAIDLAPVLLSEFPGSRVEDDESEQRPEADHIPVPGFGFRVVDALTPLGRCAPSV